jgi:hypothetical protein
VCTKTNFNLLLLIIGAAAITALAACSSKEDAQAYIHQCAKERNVRDYNDCMDNALHELDTGLLNYDIVINTAREQELKRRGAAASKK